jgi:hypothetical protein
MWVRLSLGPKARVLNFKAPFMPLIPQLFSIVKFLL